MALTHGEKTTPLKPIAKDIPDLEQVLSAMAPKEWVELSNTYRVLLKKAVEAGDVEKSIRLSKIMIALTGRRVEHESQRNSPSDDLG